MNYYRIITVRPELVEGRECHSARSWFDKPVLSTAEGLTTIGTRVTIL